MLGNNVQKPPIPCRDCGCPPSAQRRVLLRPAMVTGAENKFHARTYSTTYAQIFRVIAQSRREGFVVTDNHGA